MDPSISVKRNVTLPVGSVDTVCHGSVRRRPASFPYDDGPLSFPSTSEGVWYVHLIHGSITVIRLLKDPRVGGGCLIALLIGLLVSLSGYVGHGAAARRGASLPSNPTGLPLLAVTLRLGTLPTIPRDEVRMAHTPWVAVVIDNSIPARPQSGLNRACIVYELPTEALITRFVAMFCDASVDPIGPVRSLRAFILDVARDFDVTVAHSGTSQSAASAVRAGAGPALNEFSQALPFRRDRRRPMPHNLYTSGSALRHYVSPGAPALSPWRWSRGATTQNASMPATPARVIEISYHPGYDVRYVYDQHVRRYRRFQAGRLAVDAVTRDPLAPQTIIVQYAHWWQAFEGPVLTSRVDLAGSGRLLVFSDGRRIEGRWRRDGSRARTTFTDLLGRPIAMPAGPVWVQVVPLGHAVRSTVR